MMIKTNNIIIIIILEIIIIILEIIIIILEIIIIIIKNKNEIIIIIKIII